MLYTPSFKHLGAVLFPVMISPLRGQEITKGEISRRKRARNYSSSTRSRSIGRMYASEDETFEVDNSDDSDFEVAAVWLLFCEIGKQTMKSDEFDVQGDDTADHVIDEEAEEEEEEVSGGANRKRKRPQNPRTRSTTKSSGTYLRLASIKSNQRSTFNSRFGQSPHLIVT